MTTASLVVSRAPRRTPTASVASPRASRGLRRDPATSDDRCSTNIEGSCASSSGCRRSSESAL
jgi:hypothetical protein